MKRLISVVIIALLTINWPALSQLKEEQEINGLNGWPGIPTDWIILDIETWTFTGFSLGGSDDISKFMVNRFDRLCENYFDLDKQKMYIEGAADTAHWDKKYSPKEHHRLQTEVGDARANFFAARADDWGIDARLLPVSTKDPERGVYVYIITALPPTKKPIKDTVIIKNCCSDNKNFFSDLKIGVGAGFTGLYTRGMNFATPTVNLLLQKGKSIRLVGTFGYLPGPTNYDDFGQHLEIIMGLELAWYPKGGWFGLATGYRGGWENVMNRDEFIERAYGLYAGPRIKLWNVLEMGVDAQISNHTDYLSSDTWWGLGVSPNVRLSYIF